MDGITLIWERILGALGVTPAPWMLSAFMLTLAALSWPFLRRTLRISRARKLLAEAERTTGENRMAIQTQVIHMIGDHPMGLVGVTEEALRRQQTPLAVRALERLRATGKEPIHVKRLEAMVYGPPPTSIEGEMAAIERLLAEDLFDQATVRLSRARRRWPEDDRLAAMTVPTSET
jgi:hypothetical protein